MTLFSIFAVASLTLLLVFWIIELFASLNRAAVPEDVDEVLGSNCVERVMQELEQVGEAQFTREEIWERMAWIWHEIRVFALASNRFLGHLLLFHCWLIYWLVWLKTLVWPHGGDLRILLGAELFLICQVKRGP